MIVTAVATRVVTMGAAVLVKVYALERVNMVVQVVQEAVRAPAKGVVLHNAQRA